VAADLIGKLLVHEAAEGRASGVIVEVEAYIGETDPACHAAPGPTKRNAPLYGPPGRAYVYLNYGIHALMNAVTEPVGAPAAVLIRALEPQEGLDLMWERRGVAAPGPGEDRDDASLSLCRGPGNLTVALGITLGHNGVDLTSGPLRIEDCRHRQRPIAWSSRIGIRVGVDRRWRCTAADSAFVSGPRPRQTGRASRGPRPRRVSG